MKRFLLLVVLAFLGYSSMAQDSTFIFMTNNSKLYSIKVGGNCSAPDSLKGNNDIATVWTTAWKGIKANPLSIALDHSTLYVSNSHDSLFKGAFDSVN